MSEIVGGELARSDSPWQFPGVIGANLGDIEIKVLTGAGGDVQAQLVRAQRYASGTVECGGRVESLQVPVVPKDGSDGTRCCVDSTLRTRHPFSVVTYKTSDCALMLMTMCCVAAIWFQRKYGRGDCDHVD